MKGKLKIVIVVVLGVAVLLSIISGLKSRKKSNSGNVKVIVQEANPPEKVKYHNSNTDDEIPETDEEDEDIDEDGEDIDDTDDIDTSSDASDDDVDTSSDDDTDTSLDEDVDVSEPATPQPNNQRAKDNDGDVKTSYDDGKKFVNNDLFLSAVPKKLIKVFNKSVPKELLQEYPDLSFVTYDTETSTIYAQSKEYYFRFEYDDQTDTYSSDSELKEYADWWTLN